MSSIPMRQHPFSVLAGGAFLLLGALLIVPAGGCSGKIEATPVEPLVKCTPGNYVFCRCADRAEGTKLCNADGASFGACEGCELGGVDPDFPPDPDAGPIEGGKDAGPIVPAVCGDKVVQDGEDCDDGNAVTNDGCDACHLAGVDPAATRSCPGLDTHVWGKPVSYVGTTTNAPNPGGLKKVCKNSPDDTPTSAALGGERIFKVTAHKTGKMSVTTTDTDYDSVIYVTTTCTTDDIDYLVCANDIDGNGGETMSFPVTAGSVYSVFVDGAGISDPNGVFRVTFSIP